MTIAAEAIQRIASNPTWKACAINALKKGSLFTLETYPIGSFVVNAIKGWRE